MELSNMPILILLLIILSHLFSNRGELIKQILARNPLSPLCNWDLSNILNKHDIFSPWYQIFTSRVISLGDLDEGMLSHCREKYNASLTEIDEDCTFEKDIIIIIWKSPP